MPLSYFTQHRPHRSIWPARRKALPHFQQCLLRKNRQHAQLLELLHAFGLRKSTCCQNLRLLQRHQRRRSHTLLQVSRCIFGQISVLGLIGRRSIMERTLRAVFSMSHLLTIAAAVRTILVFVTPHLGPRQLSLNMLNIHELSDRRRTRGGIGW